MRPAGSPPRPPTGERGGGHCTFPQEGQVFPADDDAPGRQPQQATEEEQERRLSAPRRTHNQGHLSSLKRDVHAFDRAAFCPPVPAHFRAAVRPQGLHPHPLRKIEAGSMRASRPSGKAVATTLMPSAATKTSMTWADVKKSVISGTGRPMTREADAVKARPATNPIIAKSRAWTRTIRASRRLLVPIAFSTPHSRPRSLVAVYTVSPITVIPTTKPNS